MPNVIYSETFFIIIILKKLMVYHLLKDYKNYYICLCKNKWVKKLSKLYISDSYQWI
jgi:hypothetical protein